jgi:hypothetical protein
MIGGHYEGGLRSTRERAGVVGAEPTIESANRNM